jgi:hypothetical protein
MGEPIVIDPNISIEPLPSGAPAAIGAQRRCIDMIGPTRIRSDESGDIGNIGREPIQIAVVRQLVRDIDIETFLEIAFFGRSRSRRVSDVGGAYRRADRYGANGWLAVHRREWQRTSA